MNIQTLATTDISTITACFNEAFENYFVPFHLSPELLSQRILGSGIDLSHSYGVFDEGELVAFMLIAIEKWKGLTSAYNGGTGVIPKYRGRRLVKQMYDVAIPHFKQIGVQQLILEVICANDKAIKAYQSVGLKIERTLACYSGKVVQQQALAENISIRKVEVPNWEVYSTFKSYLPAWDHADVSIKRTIDRYTVLEMYENDNLLAYAMINPASGAIPQFAVADTHRKNRLGTALFSEMASIKNPIKLNNVDTGYPPVHEFLKHLGLTNTIDQYEMLGSL